MNKSLRKVICWGIVLSVYALAVAVVIQLLNPELKSVKSLSETVALAVERNNNSGSLIDQVGQSEALSGIFIKSTVGSYTNTFIVSAIAACIGLGISFLIKERKAVKAA